jgi:tellurite resistance protein TerC
LDPAQTTLVAPTLAWIGFLALVFALLFLDLYVFHRKASAPPVRTALRWSAFWIGMGLAFGLWVGVDRGPAKAVEYLTCYVTEESLSVDNLFVFLALFGYFQVPTHLQHRALFFGILGAMVMRAAFIFAGIELIQRFSWVLYVFGAFLVLTGVKLAFTREQKLEPGKNIVVRLARRLFPVLDQLEGERFFVRRGGRLVATPLFLVLLAIESTDVVFAVDSVPAALGVSRDSYIVYTSNIMAILGLRSIYFALAAVADLFHYLRIGLALVLVFIGGKMIAAELFHVHVPSLGSLGIVVGILALSIAASVAWPMKRE